MVVRARTSRYGVVNNGLWCDPPHLDGSTPPTTEYDISAKRADVESGSFCKVKCFVFVLSGKKCFVFIAAR